MIAQAAILDAQYLRVERRFRGLFDQIRGKDWTKLPTFEIGLKTAPQSSYWNALGSWSILICGVAFADMNKARMVAAGFIEASNQMRAVTEGKDKQVATDPRRLAVVEPPPFAPQFLEAERTNAIDLALDRSRVHRSHS